MIKAGILGGSGYTAGELIRLLANHPDVELQWIQSSTNAGNLVSDVHQGLEGDFFMRFSPEADLSDIDILFLCTPHGKSSEYLESVEIPEDLRIVDMSMDYRMPHEYNDFVYGLPELNRKPMVRGAKHVANPGCYATAIELSLLPLARNVMLNAPIHITAISGSTASGSKLRDFTHYSWRNDNVQIYRPLQHQHLPEIKNLLSTVQPGFNQEINFIPMRGSFSRGIMTVIYMDCPLGAEEVKKMYHEFYSDHSFTNVTDKPVDLKDVVNTNKCLINIEKVGEKLVITTVIDNLLKGASGNAVHCMNLLFGLQERVGLTLKASAF